MSQIRKIHSIFHGRTFLSHYCIVHQRFFFFFFCYGKEGTYFSTYRKQDQLQIQKEVQMPQHTYLPANISFLCFIRALGMNYSWDPYFRCLLCLVAKSTPAQPQESSALCCRHSALCHPGILRSQVTEAVQAVPVASAVETAVCPPSVMAEMCGRLSLNSMPQHPHHTHPHT